MDGSVARLQFRFEALPSHRICGIVQYYKFVEKIDSAAILEQTNTTRTIELLNVNIDRCMVWRPLEFGRIEALGYL